MTQDKPYVITGLFANKPGYALESVSAKHGGGQPNPLPSVKLDVEAETADSRRLGTFEPVVLKNLETCEERMRICTVHMERVVQNIEPALKMLVKQLQGTYDKTKRAKLVKVWKRCPIVDATHSSWDRDDGSLPCLLHDAACAELEDKEKSVVKSLQQEAGRTPSRLPLAATSRAIPSRE